MRAFQFIIICSFLIVLISCKSDSKSLEKNNDDCEFWVNLTKEFQEGQNGYHNYLKNQVPNIFKNQNNVESIGKHSSDKNEEYLITLLFLSHRYQRANQTTIDSVLQFFYYKNKSGLDRKGITLEEDKFYEVITSDVIEKKWMTSLAIDSVIRKKAIPYIKEHGLPVKEDSLCKEAYKSVLYNFAKDIELQHILQELKDNNRITKEDLFLANANLLK